MQKRRCFWLVTPEKTKKSVGQRAQLNSEASEEELSGLGAAASIVYNARVFLPSIFPPKACQHWGGTQ
jgi:hypothetical protein